MSLRIWFVLATSGAAVVGCAAASSSSNDVQMLLARDRQWAQLSATSRNVDSIVAYWTDDARVVEPGQAVVAGKPALRGMVNGSMSVPGFHVSWTPDSAVISRSGDLAYSYGTNEFTAPDSTGSLVTTRGRYIAVWRKEADGQWRCSEDYGSPGPTANAPST
jgi:ketosteroid isomerase-like protein